MNTPRFELQPARRRGLSFSGLDLDRFGMGRSNQTGKVGPVGKVIDVYVTVLVSKRTAATVDAEIAQFRW